MSPEECIVFLKCFGTLLLTRGTTTGKEESGGSRLRT